MTGDRGGPSPPGSERPLALYPWRDRAVLGATLAALMAGFGQFGAVAALGGVASTFGQVTHGTSLADQAGLSGTELGIGLAVLRLASLGGLPLAGLADRFGRRPLLLGTVAAGLALTALAAASPGYWWFVALFAAGRPALSATNALAAVIAAETTDAAGRGAAMALVAAGYGVGAGLIAVLHGLTVDVLGFRGLFALALVPLALLPFLRRWVREPDRFSRDAAGRDRPLPVLGAVGPRFRRRLLTVAGVAFFLAVITGPATSFVFLYAQNVRHQPGLMTAGMVVGAGVAGLGGLLGGRWLADHLGRRPACTLGFWGLAVFGVLTYAGPTWSLVVGYILGVGAGSLLAPGAGALVNEIFPTAVRASVLGWWIVAGVLGAVVGLVAFGAVADVGDRFGLAAVVTFLPALLATPLIWMVPESRGLEPEVLTA